MFYTVKNYTSKKSLKADVAAGVQVRLFAPGLGNPPVNGITAIGGPHYPKPHTWYAEVTVQDGIVVKVK